MPLWWNWQTRLTQNQVPKGVSVRVRLEAPNILKSKLQILNNWECGVNRKHTGRVPFQRAVQVRNSCQK